MTGPEFNKLEGAILLSISVIGFLVLAVSKWRERNECPKCHRKELCKPLRRRESGLRNSKSAMFDVKTRRCGNCAHVIERRRFAGSPNYHDLLRWLKFGLD